MKRIGLLLAVLGIVYLHVSPAVVANENVLLPASATVTGSVTGESKNIRISVYDGQKDVSQSSPSGELQMHDIESGSFSLSVPVPAEYRLITLVISSAETPLLVHKTVVYPSEMKTVEYELTSELQNLTDELPRAITQDTRDTQEERYSAQYTPSSTNLNSMPATINVAITAYANCSNWVNAGQPVLRVDTIPFKDYVKNVLPNEWISSWETEALRAGAVAVKNYGWRKVNIHARSYLQSMHNLDKAPDVVDNTCDQRYIANTNRASTDRAVDDTWNYRITANNALVNNFYLATESQCSSSPYQPCMPQWGTQYRAQEGKNWHDIIQMYYGPGVDITNIFVLNYPPPEPGSVLYRFWSPKLSRHFFTSNETERNTIRDQQSEAWNHEGFASWLADPNDPAAQPVYRFWSQRLLTHFFTMNVPERDYVIEHYPDDVWQYEGIAYYAFPLEATGNYVTFYRFWSPKLGTHFYTSNEVERDFIIANYPTNVWSYEGPIWKVPRNGP